MQATKMQNTWYLLRFLILGIHGDAAGCQAPHSDGCTAADTMWIAGFKERSETETQ